MSLGKLKHIIYIKRDDFPFPVKGNVEPQPKQSRLLLFFFFFLTISLKTVLLKNFR
jgi:hypothetical protein